MLSLEEKEGWYCYRWKAAKAGGGVESAVSELTLKDKTGQEIEKRLPGGKVKKKAKTEVVLETSTRSKKKCVTTIQGMFQCTKLRWQEFAAGRCEQTKGLEAGPSQSSTDSYLLAADVSAGSMAAGFLRLQNKSTGEWKLLICLTDLLL